MGTPQTRVSAKSIYFAVIDIVDGKQRTRYVERACDGNAELRGEVDQLLAAHQMECSNLFARGVQQLNPQATAEREEEAESCTAAYDLMDVAAHPVIDRYKLLEEIGRGGMGTVYMAQQTEPIKRRVALKLINPGMDSREVIARFEVERQALAMMDHPNIARVLDAGTTEAGRPFFVMELVRGVPITRYCQQHQLDLDDRMGLFIDVCHAVQHAHQKGIIHRDLKPANVMVSRHDGVPVVKVIDFGVAKALHYDLTDKTLFTNFSQMVGTPLYISPEQVEFGGLDVDTRSDIYSLGVLLYELLTDTTPFDRKLFAEVGIDGVRQIIRDQEPPRPSTRLTTLAEANDSTIKARAPYDSRKLAIRLRSEIDWVVMKALEKDRTRRYDSAVELANDVRRYLDDEPVEAHPPSKAYRFERFIRRNKTTTAAIVAVMLTLLLGAGIAGAQAVRAQKAERLAKKQEQIALRQRELAQQEAKRAEKNLWQAREAVDRLFIRRAQKLAEIPRMQKVQLALMEDALEFYEGFLKQSGSDPSIRLETAQAYVRVAFIRKQLGHGATAFSSAVKGTELYEQMIAGHPADTELRQSLADAYTEVAWSASGIDKRPEGLNYVRKALEIRKQMVADFPARHDFGRALAQQYVDLAIFLGEQDPSSAEHYQRSLEILEKLLEQDGRLDVRFGLGAAHQGIGATLLRSTDPLSDAAKAERSFRIALNLYQEELKDGTSPWVRYCIAQVHLGLGHSLGLQGDSVQELLEYGRAVDVLRELVDDFPSVQLYRSQLSSAYSKKHGILCVTEQFVEAEQALRSAPFHLQQLPEGIPQLSDAATDIASYHSDLGAILYWTEGAGENVLESYRRAHELYAQVSEQFPGNHKSKIRYAWFLVNCPLPQFHNGDRAVKIAKSAMQHLTPRSKHWKVLGAGHYRTGQWEQAVVALEKSAAMDRSDPDSSFYLAMSNWHLGRRDEARRRYDQALTRMKRSRLAHRILHKEVQEVLGIENIEKATTD